jgi:hypothetical protein
MDEERQASNVVSVLVRANELSEGKLKMDDSELASKSNG